MSGISRISGGDAASYIDNLSETGLSALLGDHGPAGRDAHARAALQQGVDQLSANARSGHGRSATESVELLLNLSLGDDRETSAAAQEALHALYTEGGDLSDRIARDTASFYNDYCTSPRDAQRADRFAASGRLLAMAAAGAKLDQATGIFSRILTHIRNWWHDIPNRPLFGDRLSAPPRDGAGARGDHPVAALGRSAAAGIGSSIDVLVDLSLAEDAAGEAAQRTLFDMFSGVAQRRPAVAEAITEKAHAAYLAQRQAPRPLPPRLLYMAGEAARPGSSTRREIADTLLGLMEAHDPALLANGTFADGNLWSRARLLDDVELSRALAAVAGRADAAVAFTEPLSHEALLARPKGAYLHAARIMDTLGAGGAKAVFLPINTGDHWVGLTVYGTPGTERAGAVFFDSAHSPRAAGIARDISRMLHEAGVLPDSVPLHMVADRMQANTPNACGLFTVAAFDKVAANPADPAGALEAFRTDFLNASPEEQADFNTGGRRHLIGTLIDGAIRERAPDEVLDGEYDAALAEAIRLSIQDDGPAPTPIEGSA